MWNLPIETLKSSTRLKVLLKFVDLGFVRETLIFQLVNLEILLQGKDVPPQGELIKGILLMDLWEEL